MNSTMEPSQQQVIYEIGRPESGWQTEFSAAERQRLLPIAETLALMDGNAFFSLEALVDSYLPHAHAVYEANGGDSGWAGQASWVQRQKEIDADPVLRDAYDQLQMLLELKRNDYENR